MLKLAVIQLTDVQLTRNLSLAVDIVDNIIEDLHLDREEEE